MKQIGKKLSIDPNELQLYACYFRQKTDVVEEQDRLDPESGLFNIRDELKLTRESKFRFGIRVPISLVESNSAASPLPTSIATPAAATSDSTSQLSAAYLLKKGEGAAVRRWKKRWFVIDRESDRIYYYHGSCSLQIIG